MDGYKDLDLQSLRGFNGIGPSRQYFLFNDTIKANITWENQMLPMKKC
jgi:ABC-type transport system involved in Fe-S cluster assembly fused permease/ATPase subunit